MASKTTVHFLDDLDGSTDDVQTVTFAVEGRQFEVDLSEKNRAKFLDLFKPYTEAGRKVGRSGSAGPSRRRVASDAGAIREWASANGVTVSERGRIPAEVREQFEAAQSK